MLPERVDERLLAWLGRGRLARIVVLPANHPNELDHTVEAALRPLRMLGVTLLNQAVLLQGINRGPRFNLGGIIGTAVGMWHPPYYLHLLDRGTGLGSILKSQRSGLAV